MYRDFFKRIVDIVLSVGGLIFLSPMLLIVCVFIYKDSGSPVFFFQQRVGRLGKEFSMCKFRTMSVKKGAEVGSFDIGSDDRVTRIGSFLRRYKIDELPQLINVAKGEMSIVGPRPEVSEWVTIYSDRWERIHTVRPGITDMAAIKFRNEEIILAASENPTECYRNEILPSKLDLYDHYIKDVNFLGDVYIIIRTLFHTVSK